MSAQSSTEIWQADGWETADAIRRGDLRAEDVVGMHLDRIRVVDPELSAWCHVDGSGALEQARRVDEKVAAGSDPGAWAGVPIGVKETQAAKGMPHEEGSLLYEGRIADHDAVAVGRLRAAGAVIVGTTTAPEFGSLNWTRTKLHGVTGNPWDPDRTPGGSSGGSAAAVASGTVPVCTGGDGGGSIRIPSSYCGLFGFKATFGRIPSLPFDTSLTAVPGPMCRSVRDAARYFDTCAGPHPADPSSLAKPDSYESLVLSSDSLELLAGRRVAWTSTMGGAVCDPEVEAVVHDAAMRLAEDAGFEIVDVEVELPRMGGAWSVISSLDMQRCHGDAAEGRFDELTPVVRAGFEYLQRSGLDGVVRAYRRRDELLDAIAALFGDIDLLLTPTVATTAFTASGPPPDEIAGRPVGGMGSVPYTAPFNISGQPAVSLPVGAVDGLPVGLQVVARRHEEPLLWAAGALVEQRRPWPKLAARRP